VASRALPFGRVVASTAQDSPGLDDLDFDIYRAFPIDKYRCAYVGTRGELVDYFPIMSSKGCPFACGYCPYPVGFGPTISYKSPERLVDEMTCLHDTFGIRAFLFRDWTFTAWRDRVEEICERILARGWTRYNTNEVVMRTEDLSGPELSSLVRTLSRRDRTRKVLKRMRRALYDKRDREYVMRRSLRKLAAMAGG